MQTISMMLVGCVHCQRLRAYYQHFEAGSGLGSSVFSPSHSAQYVMNIYQDVDRTPKIVLESVVPWSYSESFSRKSICYLRSL